MKVVKYFNFDFPHDDQYIPYDIFYKGEVRELKDISTNNYAVLRTLDKANKKVEELMKDPSNYLYGNEMAVEYLVKLLYNKDDLYAILTRGLEFSIKPHPCFVEFTLNSINLVDDDLITDITDNYDSLRDIIINNWDPIIVDYPQLINDLDKRGISHTFKSIDEMHELVKEEGFVNPNPIVKKKILNKIYH